MYVTLTTGQGRMQQLHQRPLSRQNRPRRSGRHGICNEGGMRLQQW